MNIEELQEIAHAERETRAADHQEIRVCVAASCISSGSEQLKDALAREVKTRGLEGCCKVKGVGCMGLCSAGPLVSTNDNRMFQHVEAKDAPAVVESVASGQPDPQLSLAADLPFFAGQTRIVLENSGIIDPDRIEDYIAAGGYESLLNCLANHTPPQVIEQVTKSGLRGRGGAGYPTGLKWTTVLKSGNRQKYVICNADEGDPGAFMDRSVLESDPHRVLEGMAIAAYAVGANRGYIYVRAEYPLAVKRLKTAIRQAEQKGLLGNDISDTRFSFRIEIRLGAGAFVCGEETALISSIEGKRGTPRPRPPYPAQEGLWGCPTLINNVETFANIAPIIRHGGEWFASIGTAKSKGTKVFALAGRVNHTGLIEVAMGTPLRDIVFKLGGGIPDNRSFKAVQTGGPSGGCVPEQFLDMPVDYESLAGVGSIMGSGGMIIMDETSCMVDVAKYFMEFCMSESCGKCIPCRVGTAHIYDLLMKIATGRGSPQDIELVERLGKLLKDTSLCGLGQTAPNPVFSTLRYFRNEFEAHVHENRCVAGACKTGEPVEVEA